MVIWAKLTQGNGRGTCFWITHKLQVILNLVLYKIYLNNKMRRIKGMPKCSIIKRCGRPIFTKSTGSTGIGK